MAEASKQMREGDWLCAECGAHNFNARVTCYQCTLPKSRSEVLSKGKAAMDWDCFKCKTSNFSWRRECFKCRISREESEELKEVHVGVEWFCRFCALVNYPNRTDCFKCKRSKGVCDGRRRPSPPRGRFRGGSPPPRPMARPRSPPPRPQPPRGYNTPDNAEWGCSLCGTFNGFRRQDCYKCGTPRRAPESGTPRRAPEYREDQGWDCVECLSDNYPDRRECYKCQAPRPGPSTRPLLSTPGNEYYEPQLEAPRVTDKVRQQYGPDWVCKFCEVEVFPTRGDCYKCGRVREECESLRVTVPMTPPGGEGYTCGCGTFNRAGQESCDWCGKPARFPRPVTRPGPVRKPQLKPGEWDCRDCRINNYPDRKVCYICKGPREEVEERAGTVRERSPLAPRRTLLEHHTRTSRFSPPPAPFRRDRSPPRRDRSPPPFRRDRSPRDRPNKRSGNYTPDWECRLCKINNFTKRMKCFRCGKDKAEVELIKNDSGKPLKPNDWLCGECNGHNFSRRTDCFKCHAAKPGLGSFEDQVMESEAGNAVDLGDEE